MNQGFIDPEIITQLQNGVGVITLNRPKALNALSLEMIRQISAVLKKWQDDKGVGCVVFAGAGERAFCSGGDVKSFYNSGMEYRRGQVDLRVPTVFFAEEYSLNKQLFHYPKPTIAFMDGITMGGGYGIAGHCRYRIASEKTIFAMPEVGIGFFPDVGVVYHLNKAPQNFGRYLALSGRHIGPGDMLAAGLADFYMAGGGYEPLLAALEKAQGQGAEAILQGMAKPAPKAEILSAHGEVLSSVFEQRSVSEIFEKLRKAGGRFAEETFDLFAKASPLSVCVTLRHLDELYGKDFDVVIDADFVRAQRFIQYPDLYEGIRAALIEKDKSPVWEPPIYNGVKDEDVERYFKPTGYGLSDVRIFVS